MLLVNGKPFDAIIFEERFKGKVLGFTQVDNDVPDKPHEKFSEMVPIFVVQ